MYLILFITRHVRLSKCVMFVKPKNYLMTTDSTPNASSTITSKKATGPGTPPTREELLAETGVILTGNEIYPACTKSRTFRCTKVCDRWMYTPQETLNSIYQAIVIAKKEDTPEQVKIDKTAEIECHYRSANAYFRKKIKGLGFCDLKTSNYCTFELPLPPRPCEKDLKYPCGTPYNYDYRIWHHRSLYMTNQNLYYFEPGRYYEHMRNSSRAENAAMYAAAPEEEKKYLFELGKKNHTHICAIAPELCTEDQY